MKNNKKWYHSKKFWVAVLPGFVALLNTILYQTTGAELPVEAIVASVTTALGYIFVEGGLDAKYMKLQENVKSARPLQDPVIRDLILSLMNNRYDYKKAADDLGMHTKDVTAHVVKSLAEMLDPDTAKDPELRTEVTRQILKKYDEDKSLMEGSALSRSAG